LLLTAVQFKPALGPALRPYLIWGGIASLGLCACFAGAFYSERVAQRAIVVTHEAVAHQAPLEESQNAFTLHDGAELQVLDEKDQWVQVQADPRRTGWVRRDALVLMPPKRQNG
jgi:uncharacterized protein YgiM (DUF1202 family)